MGDWYVDAAQTGLTHPDGSGDFERFVPSGTWTRPAHVALQDGHIDGEPALFLVTSGKWEQATLERGCFSDFLELADAAPEAILDYAGRWGVLALCRDHWHPSALGHPAGVVMLEPPGFWPSTADTDEPPIMHDRVSCGDSIPAQRIEPIEAWRMHSRRMRAALHIAAALKRADNVESEQWAPLGRNVIYPNHPHETLAIWLHWHMSLCGVSPYVRWSGPSEEPRLELTGGSLFAALALQLALAIAGRSGYVACSECGRLHEVTRAPQAGRNNYCPECAASGARFRRASKKYHQRKREVSDGS